MMRHKAVPDRGFPCWPEQSHGYDSDHDDDDDDDDGDDDDNACHC